MHVTDPFTTVNNVYSNHDNVSGECRNIALVFFKQFSVKLLFLHFIRQIRVNYLLYQKNNACKV